MGFYLSRQRDFKDDCLYIEIANGGQKKAGIDILTPRYTHECKNFIDPRDAVRLALEMYKRWQLDYHDEIKRLRIVDTAKIFVLDFDQRGANFATGWADKIYTTMTKCNKCNITMGNRDLVEAEELPNMVFCSENCLSRKYLDAFGTSYNKKVDLKKKKK